MRSGGEQLNLENTYTHNTQIPNGIYFGGAFATAVAIIIRTPLKCRPIVFRWWVCLAGKVFFSLCKFMFKLYVYGT